MAFAKGKYAKAISDRSGMEFPYNEMIREWNGSFVHKSEYNNFNSCTLCGAYFCAR